MPISPEDLLARLGKTVSNGRKAAGLSADEFAEQIGIKRSQLAELETGLRDSTVTELAVCASVLGMKPGQLLTRALGKGSRRNSPLAMGTVVVTIVSGADSEIGALVMHPDDAPPLVDALHRPIRAFAASVGADTAESRNQSALIDDYPGREANRIAGGALTRTKRRSGPVRLWVAPAARPAAIEALVDELAASKVQPGKAVEALELCLEAFEEVEVTLSPSGRLQSDRTERERRAEEIRQAIAEWAAS